MTVGCDGAAGTGDEVSAGDRNYKDVLDRFWRDFSAAISETSELRITEVLEKINEVLEPHLFPPKEDGSDPRLCPNCGAGRLSMRTARSGGAFIGCSNYPECRYTRAFAPPGDGDDEARGDTTATTDQARFEPVELELEILDVLLELGQVGLGRSALFDFSLQLVDGGPEVADLGLHVLEDVHLENDEQGNPEDRADDDGHIPRLVVEIDGHGFLPAASRAGALLRRRDLRLRERAHDHQPLWHGRADGAEPTGGLDPLMQQEVLSLIREAKADGATVFFSSHIMSEVETVAERVAIIRQGRIAEVRQLEPGTPAISPARFPDWEDEDPFRHFADEVRELAGRARDKQLTPEEMTPINPEVENKRILVDVPHQTLSCYEGDIEVQTKQVMENLTAVLETAGTSLAKRPWRGLTRLNGTAINVSTGMSNTSRRIQ